MQQVQIQAYGPPRTFRHKISHHNIFIEPTEKPTIKWKPDHLILKKEIKTKINKTKRKFKISITFTVNNKQYHPRVVSTERLRTIEFDNNRRPSGSEGNCKSEGQNEMAVYD